MNRIDALRQFYDLLGQLERPQPLRSLALASLPARGVYFFFEPGEVRSDSGTGLRVVRVGTHALTTGSRSTLTSRLRQHRGSAHGGNHRGSIFRLLVGEAMLSSATVPECTSWGVKGQRKLAAQALGLSDDEVRRVETPVEAEVSARLGSMQFQVVEISDDPGSASLRGYVERNAIALLSNFGRPPLDPASSQWLGLKSGRPMVCASGLWNQRHVTDQVEADFLARFAELTSGAA